MCGLWAFVVSGDGVLSPTPSKGPPVIFLDIDGVLNRTKHNTHIRLDADLVACLKRLMDATGAVIVLSTF